MKISFDLDDTLIPSQSGDFPVERKNTFQKLFGIESIRKGTVDLINALQESEHSVGVYTTSYRSKLKIFLTFLTYGLILDFIINEKQNRRKLKKKGIYCSKFPPAFGIDLHVDDSKGVGLEGVKNNFQTVIVRQSDTDWKNQVMKACASK